MAIEPTNVLVLYNADDGAQGDGFQIADYYQQARPGVHLLGITGINAVLTGSTGEEISAQDYLSVIRPQVLAGISGIQDSIDVIVTTKRLPLLVNTGEGPINYCETGSTTRRYSSLESELNRIDSIDTVDEMSDQLFFKGLHQYDMTLPSNPYYDTNGPFVRAGSDPVNGDIRLSSRLDGFDVQDVKDAIDRAQRVFVVPHDRGHYVIADDDPTAGVDQIVDTSPNGLGPGPGLVSVLDAHGQATVYENTDAAVTDLIDPGTGWELGTAIGYVSHGTNDGTGGLTADYIQNQLDFDLADGAVFLTHESFNARSFDPGFSQTQGLVAEWIERGGTAGLGHVQEPCNGPDNVTNEDLLFDMLLPVDPAQPGSTGLTFVEAAWNATRQLSYVNTVIGDPLMQWQAWLPGDANLDGKVNLNDLAILQINWLDQGTVSNGDFNGDGWINLNDLAILQINWLGSIVEPIAQAASSGFPELDPATGQLLASTEVPEPQSLMLLVLALLGWLSLGAARHGRPMPQKPF